MKTAITSSPTAHVRHFAGPLRWTSVHGDFLRTAVAGWPICLSGGRAERARKRGQLTPDRTRVTCPQCREYLAGEVPLANPGGDR